MKFLLKNNSQSGLQKQSRKKLLLLSSLAGSREKSPRNEPRELMRQRTGASAIR